MLALALVAAACDGGAPTSERLSSPTPLLSPRVITTGQPEAFDAAALETAFPIKHVVFLIKENRTFDNLFGTFPGANGVTVGMDRGAPRPLVRGTGGRTSSDIPHCYPCALAAWNGGAMDGFDQGEGGDWAYTQLQRDQLPNYWRWAEEHALFADREATPMLTGFDFDQEPREPEPLALRDDCEGPIWAPAT
jgi:phospholipase C